MHVPLGDASYDVVIGAGLLREAAERIPAACPAAAYAIITDSSVAPLYGERLAASLDAVAPTTVVTFPSGEWNKTRETWGELSDGLVAQGLGRDGAVVALGGGVTGDLAGFVAATYLRGIPYVQLPTTLLAMIDSSIGGKTGVDVPAGKNLIGAFHQPRLVLADTTTLATLPKPHRAAGLAEALKHGVIADAAYVDAMLADAARLVEGDAAASAACVERSVAIKAGVVAEDEREAGRRAILNFGHTVAHAIEAASGYGVLHGEAVALGMLVESELGVALGVTDPAVPGIVRAACESLHLPLDPPELPSRSTLIEIMATDKKARAGTVRFALPSRVGAMATPPEGGWTFAAEPAAIDAALSILG